MEKEYPSYLNLLKSGEYLKRVEKLNSILKECTLCPHECRINRVDGETGICESTFEIKISSAFPHFGEEAPISGYRGSGTIFLSNCSLRCLFCQNYDISHLSEGKFVTIEQLANVMLYLQDLRCHNINFVTPTHYIAGIIEAVFIAAENGLKLPIVYNSSGYDSVEILKLLDGIIDIYMPDYKFSDNGMAKEFTTAADYNEVARRALIEMFRQQGDLEMDSKGIAKRGLLIRHLVMPDSLHNTEGVLKFISERISKNTYVNVMAQFHPCYKAAKSKGANRRITHGEYKTARQTAKDFGLKRGF